MPEAAIYAGTFDPVTYGHLDLVERALRIFGRLILAVAHNPEKKPLFSVSERVDMLRQVTKDFGTVEVDSLDGLLVDYARTRKAQKRGGKDGRGIPLNVSVADSAKHLDVLELDDALASARRSVQLNPAPNFIATLARAYYRKDMYSDAEKEIRRAISMEPDNESYRALLAEIQEQRGR